MECSVRIRHHALQVLSHCVDFLLCPRLWELQREHFAPFSLRRMVLVVSPECAFWDQQGEERCGNLGQEKPTLKEHCAGKAL